MFLKQQLRRTIFRFSTSAAISGLLSRSRAWHYITQVEPGLIELTELRLPIRGLSPAFAGLRLVQLSDIHIGTWINPERLAQAVRMALAAKPDVVLLTGDYLPGYGWSAWYASKLAELAAGLRPLASACPTFSVPGNHDLRTNASAIREALSRVGITDLTNAVYTLQRGSARFYIAGVDDMRYGRPRLDRVCEQLTTDDPAILMAHEPDFADISAATGRFALQVSGHTHGGQVVLPYVGPLLLPSNGRKYPSGLYQVGEMYQYTNRGIGTGYQHVRFNCRPEITLFVMEPSEYRISRSTAPIQGYTDGT